MREGEQKKEEREFVSRIPTAVEVHTFLRVAPLLAESFDDRQRNQL
jgi:hypothetical protein